jgi:mRNA-degrading endonuclease RelE of RelBE toxin-antitoxin system
MMRLKLKKQPQKYLASVDANTRRKLYKALEQLARLEGDIVPLAGQKNLYRFKISHYRILFERIKGELVITVVEINTRTNIHY